MIDKMTTTATRPRRLVACLVLLTALPLAGCLGSSQRRTVNAPRGPREALKIALDHWKKGEDPKTLESSEIPMVAQDFKWAGGAKLIDYQIVNDGKEEDVNLRIPVKLTLKNVGKDKEKPVEKKASYVVGTSPSVTIFRDIMRR